MKNTFVFSSASILTFLARATSARVMLDSRQDQGGAIIQPNSNVPAGYTAGFSTQDYEPKGQQSVCTNVCKNTRSSLHSTSDTLAPGTYAAALSISMGGGPVDCMPCGSCYSVINAGVPFCNPDPYDPKCGGPGGTKIQRGPREITVLVVNHCPDCKNSQIDINQAPTGWNNPKIYWKKLPDSACRPGGTSPAVDMSNISGNATSGDVSNVMPSSSQPWSNSSTTGTQPGDSQQPAGAGGIIPIQVAQPVSPGLHTNPNIGSSSRQRNGGKKGSKCKPAYSSSTLAVSQPSSPPSDSANTVQSSAQQPSDTTDTTNSAGGNDEAKDNVLQNSPIQPAVNNPSTPPSSTNQTTDVASPLPSPSSNATSPQIQLSTGKPIGQAAYAKIELPADPAASQGVPNPGAHLNGTTAYNPKPRRS